MNANATTKMELYKKGRDGKMWPKVIYPSDWRSERGFKALVVSTSEQEENSLKNIQKFQFVLQQFPNNSALRIIAQKRMLETIDLTPEEMREVQDAEEEALKMQQSMQQMQLQQGMAPEGLQGSPQQGAVPSPLQQPLTPQGAQA